MSSNGRGRGVNVGEMRSEREITLQEQYDEKAENEAEDEGKDEGKDESEAEFMRIC
jgi:hypothetical protein